MYPRDAGGGGRLRGVAPILIGLLMLSIVPGTALAQESVWTDMAPATSPSRRGIHDMAYDGESDRIVLFGGWLRVNSGRMDDTWAYDFNENAWTNMSPGSGPSPRGGHAMAYDAESDRVILYGGLEIPGPETWAYDFNANTWTNMSPVVQPVAWSFADMAYNANADRIVFFGGCATGLLSSCFVTEDETWVYDYNVNTWTNMNPGPSPSRRLGHRMAYDGQSDRIVLFGGAPNAGPGYFSDTWAYDLNANSWTEMNPPEAPSLRDVHGMAYDATADQVVLFGGSPPTNDTWTYDLDSDTWTPTGSGVGPSRRGAVPLAYDSESDRIVLFGGHLGRFPSILGDDETWAHQLVPSGPDPIPPWVYIVIGVAAAAVVAVVAIILTRRRGRMRKGEGGE